MTSTNTPEVARLAEERQRFEAYIRKDCGDLTTFGRGENMHYLNSAVNNAWGGWLERAKQDAAPTSASTVPAGFWLAPMEPDAEMFDAAKYDESFIEAWDDMRNAYLARNPGACSVTDGEAKK